MIAAIFPVAIMQTQATMEETVGTTVTRNGISYMRGSPLMNAAKLPFTGSSVAAPAPPTPPNPAVVYSFNDPRIVPGAPPNDQPAPNDKPLPQALWNSIKQNLIVSDDSRFAYVPMYVRDPGSNFTKLIVIGVRIRTRDQFKSGTGLDTERRAGGVCAELEPRPVKVALVDGTAGGTADRIIIENLDIGPAALQTLSQNSNAVDAAVADGYVIISEDGIADDNTTPFKNEHGRLNGRIYRLGPELQSPGAGQRAFELAAGDDMASNAENQTDAIAFIVGRGYADVAGTNYGGPSMAVQRYENVIALPSTP
jgi:hypothetical protein